MNNKKEKKPDFAKREEKWLKVWEKQSWAAAVDFDKKRKKKYILVEFPYPSGKGLHIGHAFTMTGADIYARKQRMSGDNVLFPMGWDAFGLPTENYALRTGISPQKATGDNTDNFRRQMKRMAFSFDWDREVNTTDPDYYRWTQWIFIRLFKKGLAYKEKRPINWCPSCRIGLANEEVVDGRCERCGQPAGKKNLSQWIVKITAYADRLIEGLNSRHTNFVRRVKAAQINWIGRKRGAVVKFKIADSKSKIKELEVFTTRPDTLWGVTFMAVAPEHDLVEQIISGKLKGESSRAKKVAEYARMTEKKSELERTELQKEKSGVFTGLYAVNPANNKRVPVWVADFVLSSYGAGAVMAVPAHDQRDWQFAKKYHLPVVPVVQPEKNWDFAKGAYEEMKGRMINSGALDGLPVGRAIKKAVEFLEKKKAGGRTVSYHLRDWIFSRQHYWGEPIPMVNCRKCGWVPVKEEDLPVKLPEVEKYQPTKTGESPLAAIKEWVEVSCPACGGKARRETDTMPNWAGSDWYFLRYLDPKNDQALADEKKMKYWLPVDIYVGGDEHNTLHMLYSRFIYQFLHDLGVVPKEYPEPYYRRISHGVILGPDGRRMSKSRGNIIDPDRIWEKYGVDALRTYLAFIGPFTGTIVWNEKALKGVVRFLEKFDRMIKNRTEAVREKGAEEMAGDLSRLVEKVSGDIDRFRFNTAVAAMMEFLNRRKSGNKRLSPDEGRVLARLIAPFAPYLAEEWWQDLGGEGSVHAGRWPVAGKKAATGEVKIAVQVDGRLRGVIKVKSSGQKRKMKNYLQEKAGRQPGVARHLAGKKVAKVVLVPGRLINFVTKGGEG